MLRDVNGIEGGTGQTAIDHSTIKLANGTSFYRKCQNERVIHFIGGFHLQVEAQPDRHS